MGSEDVEKETIGVIASDESASQKTCRVREVLVNGRRRLWDADFPNLRVLFDPWREYVWDPTLVLATILLPPLTNMLGVDYFVSHLLEGSFYLLPSGRAHPDDYLRRNAANQVLHANPGGIRPPHFHRPSDFDSALQGVFAFVCGAAADVVGALMNPRKMKKWVAALSQFKTYVDASGVSDELEEAIVKPLLCGRLLDNIKILSDIQEITDANRPQQTLQQTHSPKDIFQEIKDGTRMMRFATAAYGTEMILSAIDKDADAQELQSLKHAICFHTGVSTDDIKLLYVNDEGDCHVLHHLVAIDRVTKSIVLALRGTLSISGVIVDIQAMDCQYCTGKAHTGMAEMADILWAHSGDKIQKLFEEDEFKNFGLIITGHSLGAGTACLLNIKCHVEKLFGEDRSIKCFAFAPPPTFSTCDVHEYLDEKIEASIQRAIANTVAYIHDNDCVPFLSVSAIRRLANMLDAVDNVTEHIWFFRRFQIFWEYRDIPKEIFDSVARARQTKTKPIDGACDMAIPAQTVIWMKKNDDGSFDGYGCNANMVSQLDLLMCDDMISDHMCGQYEDALDALVAAHSDQE